MTNKIAEITNLYLSLGSGQYGGEAVSQLQHALQCASLAENSGATPELICAALLHDLGHLLRSPTDQDTQDKTPDVDDLHQYFAIPFLRSAFSEAVIEPIKLHVDAKKYLCAVDPLYWESLSPASKNSLALQGGAYSADEAAAFLRQPYAEDAVNLRRWDDQAKDPAAQTAPWAHFLTKLEALGQIHSR